MSYELRELRGAVRVLSFLILVMGAARAAAGDLSADEIARRAEQQRGLPNAHTFRARIALAGDDTQASGGDESVPRTTVVEVRSNGFAQQLVFVLAPDRGDVMLSTPDIVWIRPRHLHRLARVPPDLRMFNGASVADVTSIDVLGSYTATLLEEDDGRSEEYRLNLTAIKEGMRYPHAAYRVRREDFRPVQIDFMTASGKILKTIVYAEFAAVLGRTIPTKLIVRDHVYRDTSIVRMSGFRVLSPINPAMFTPDYLLTIPDPT